jgi:tetratricopeptide (TPR) repeat protein/serine phosphatase RsbU (regulator of sigma subunit)
MPMSLPIRYLCKMPLPHLTRNKTSTVFALIFFAGCCFQPLHAQILPRKFYLADSLNEKQLSPPEKKLIDSVLTRFHKNTDDTLRMSLLDFLAENCSEGVWQQYNSILKTFALSCLKGSKTYSDEQLRSIHRRLGAAYNNEGLDNFNSGRPASAARESYSKADSLLMRAGDTSGLAALYNNIALLYKYQGNIKAALDFYGKSLHFSQLLKNDNQVAGTLANIGRIYEDQGDIEEAKNNYLKSLEIKRKLKNVEGQANALNNLGLLYSRQQKFDEAMKLYEESLRLLDSVNVTAGKATTFHNIGNLLQAKKQYAEAIVYYEKTLEIYRQNGNATKDANTFVSLAYCQFLLGETDKAEKNAQTGLEIAQAMGYPEYVMRASIALEKIYNAKKKYKEALGMLHLYLQMHDSLFNQQNRNATYKQEARLEFEKKEAVMKAEQKNRDFIAAEEKNKQRNRLIITSVAGLVALLFLLAVYRNLRVNKSKNRIIQEQKELVENKNKEILDSINYAKQIQEAILPPVSLITTWLPETFILFKPKDVVAGDFYFFEHNGDSVFIAAADCTGHGVPGALVSVICSVALNRCVKELGLKMPGEILDKTTELISETFRKSGEDVRDGMDISLLVLSDESAEKKNGSVTPSFNRGNANIKFYWAGANNPLWYVSENETREIAPNKQSVGQYENRKAFTTHAFSPQRGSVLYLFSDGYADQFGGPKGKKFKYLQLKNLVLSVAPLSVNEQQTKLNDSFEQWKGNLEQVDDVCVIGIRV